MGELETDPKTEAPLYPPRIIGTEVVLNPFEDIIPRERLVLDVEQTTNSTRSSTSLNSNLKKKNVSLLSFADDEDEFKSSKLREPQISTIPDTPKPVPPSSSSLQFLHQMKSVQMKETQEKIRAMEEELGLRTKKNEPVADQHPQHKKEMSALEKHKAKFAKRKSAAVNKVEDEEVDTLLLLNSFRQKIQKTSQDRKTKTRSDDTAAPVRKHLDICKLHGLLDCLSCKDTFNVNLNANASDDFDEKDWMMHKLVFDRRELEGQVREDLKELVVIDPREQINKNKNK